MSTTTQMTLPWSYEILPSQTANDLLSAAKLVHALRRDAATSILEIGHCLHRWREKLGLADFARWVKFEFEIELNSAQRYIKAYLDFDQADLQDKKITGAALLFISGETVPAAAVEEVKTKIENNEPVTKEVVVKIVKEAKAAKRPPIQQPPLMPTAKPEPEPKPEPEETDEDKLLKRLKEQRVSFQVNISQPNKQGVVSVGYHLTIGQKSSTWQNETYLANQITKSQILKSVEKRWNEQQEWWLEQERERQQPQVKMPTSLPQSEIDRLAGLNQASALANKKAVRLTAINGKDAATVIVVGSASQGLKYESVDVCRVIPWTKDIKTHNGEQFGYWRTKINCGSEKSPLWFAIVGERVTIKAKPEATKKKTPTTEQKKAIAKKAKERWKGVHA